MRARLAVIPAKPTRTAFDHHCKERITVTSNSTIPHCHAWSIGERWVDDLFGPMKIGCSEKQQKLTVLPWEVSVAAGGRSSRHCPSGQGCKLRTFVPYILILEFLVQRAGSAYMPFCFRCQTRYLGGGAASLLPVELEAWRAGLCSGLHDHGAHSANSDLLSLLTFLPSLTLSFDINKSQDEKWPIWLSRVKKYLHTPYTICRWKLCKMLEAC